MQFERTADGNVLIHEGSFRSTLVELSGVRKKHRANTTTVPLPRRPARVNRVDYGRLNPSVESREAHRRRESAQAIRERARRTAVQDLESRRRGVCVNYSSTPRELHATPEPYVDLDQRAASVFSALDSTRKRLEGGPVSTVGSGTKIRRWQFGEAPEEAVRALVMSATESAAEVYRVTYEELASAEWDGNTPRSLGDPLMRLEDLAVADPAVEVNMT